MIVSVVIIPSTKVISKQFTYRGAIIIVAMMTTYMTLSDSLTLTTIFP